MEIDKIKIESFGFYSEHDGCLVCGRIKVYYCGFENCISIPITERCNASTHIFKAEILDILREKQIIQSQVIRFSDLKNIAGIDIDLIHTHCNSLGEFRKLCDIIKTNQRTALIANDMFCLFFKSGVFGTDFYKDTACTNFYCRHRNKRLRKEQNVVINSYRYHCIPAPKEEESKREAATIRYSNDMRGLFYVSLMGFESGDTYVSFGNVANEIAKLEKYGYDVNVLLDSKHYRSRS